MLITEFLTARACTFVKKLICEHFGSVHAHYSPCLLFIHRYSPYLWRIIVNYYNAIKGALLCLKVDQGQGRFLLLYVARFKNIIYIYMYIYIRCIFQFWCGCSTTDLGLVPERCNTGNSDPGLNVPRMRNIDPWNRIIIPFRNRPLIK